MERGLSRAVGSTYLVRDVLGLERLLLGGGELFRCQREAVLLGKRPGESSGVTIRARAATARGGLLCDAATATRAEGRSP